MLEIENQTLQAAAILKREGLQVSASPSGALILSSPPQTSTPYYMEAMICRSWGGDSGDWWTIGETVTVPKSQDVDAAFAAYVQRVHDTLDLDSVGGFIVGVYPYACTEAEDEEDWEETD